MKIRNNFTRTKFKSTLMKAIMVLLAIPGILLTNSCKGTTNPISEHAKTKENSKNEINEIILFCGNPGVGKSTLCNSIFQKVVFQSGVSVGGGMTINKQEHIYAGRLYIDTPGLDDVQLKEKAAEEIEKSLKQNNNYKIVFVATLEAGRIKPADLVTINTVCEAIKTDFEYGIIFNKVTQQSMNKIKQINQEGLLVHLATLKKKPSSTIILMKDGNMEDEDNVLFDEKNRKIVLDFISNLKANNILDTQVEEVDVRDYQKKIEELEAQYKKEIAALNSQLQASSEQINSLKLEQEKAQKKLHETTGKMKQIEEAHQKSIQEMKEKQRGAQLKHQQEIEKTKQLIENINKSHQNAIEKLQEDNTKFEQEEKEMIDKLRKNYEQNLKQNEKKLEKMRQEFYEEQKNNQDKLDQMQLIYNEQQKRNAEVMERNKKEISQMQNKINYLQDRKGSPSFMSNPSPSRCSLQ